MHVLGLAQAPANALIFLFVAMATMHGLVVEVPDGTVMAETAAAYIKEVHFLVVQRGPKAVVVSQACLEEEEELVVTEAQRPAPAQAKGDLVAHKVVAKVEHGIIYTIKATNVQLLVLMAVAAVVVVIILTLINLDMDIHFFTDLEVVVAELEYMV